MVILLGNDITPTRNYVIRLCSQNMTAPPKYGQCKHLGYYICCYPDIMRLFLFAG